MTDGYDIVIIAGASNALGAGRGKPTTWQDPGGPVYQITEPELGRFELHRKTKGHQRGSYEQAPGFGLGIAFGRRHAARGLANGRKVAYTTAWGAFGRTVTEYERLIALRPETELRYGLFRRAVRRAKWALDLPGDNRIIGIVLQAGEEAVGNAEQLRLTPGRFAGLYIDLISNLRTALGPVPVTIGEMSKEALLDRPHKAEFLAALKGLTNRLPSVAFVHSDGLDLNTPDRPHFSGQGAADLGARHWDAMAPMLR